MFEAEYNQSFMAIKRPDLSNPGIRKLYRVHQKAVKLRIANFHRLLQIYLEERKHFLQIME